MIFGGHGEATLPELAEVGVAGDGVGVLGVDVEEIDEAISRRSTWAGLGRGLLSNAAEEAAEGGCLEGVEEEEDEWAGWQWGGESVSFDEANGGEEIVAL